MNPATIIREVAADGVALALSDAGSIKAIGEASAVNRWLPTIRKHKPQIVAALRDAARNRPIPDDLEKLIVRAGTFWEYSPEDYDLIRELARGEPDGLRLALESDVAFSRATNIFQRPHLDDGVEHDNRLEC